jgi:anti-sigma regulatory factor (Ser/Thr protein kinase)
MIERAQHNSSRSVLTLVFRARYTTLDESVDAIEQCLPFAYRTDLTRMGIAEALANSMIHGALRVPSQPRDEGRLEEWLALIERAEREREDEIVAVCINAHGPGISLEFSDSGPGFDWRAAPIREGRGLSILHTVFDAVRWNEAGNTLSVHLLQPARSS